MGYTPIGSPLRWNDDMRRGETWGIIAAYTTDSYYPCVGIR